MSRIGVKPIKIYEGVEVEPGKSEVKVKGPLGELTQKLPRTVEVKIGEEGVVVSRKGNSKQAKADHGTHRILIENMMKGVKDGYKKELELVGMGYRASMEGETLVMALGWNHPVKIEPPEGLKFSVDQDVNITISGIDKQLVGLWSAKIRNIRKPEPYKGKGIRYKDEVVRRKTSKTVKEEE